MIEEQRRRLAELKQKAAAEAQCQWDALHGAAPFPPGPSGFPPLVHHSILHHLPVGRERGEDGEHAYDTLSLESSDSMETSISTGGTSACSPDNMSRYAPRGPALPLPAARRALDAPTLPLPQRQRPGRGQDRGDGEAAERSARGEEPAHGVPGEAAAPAPGASTASLEEKERSAVCLPRGEGAWPRGRCHGSNRHPARIPRRAKGGFRPCVFASAGVLAPGSSDSGRPQWQFLPRGWGGKAGTGGSRG